MTLVLKPFGRGKWAPVTLQLSGRGVDNLFYRVGQPYDLNGQRFRIAEVRV